MIGESVALEFNSRINGRDLDGLADLMPDDHTFVDTEGNVISGKPDCLNAWRGFFQAFPDYRNIIESLTARGDLVVLAGHSVCPQPALAGPALWTAMIRDGRVAEWRVYEDTPQTRHQLAIPDAIS